MTVSDRRISKVERGMHTFTVELDLAKMGDRAQERVDWAVSILRDIPGVNVSGWCDDE